MPEAAQRHLAPLHPRAASVSPARRAPARRAHRAVLHVVLATLLGAGLRVVAAIPGGMWRDEALFVFVVRLGSWGSMLRWVATEESHPPLYYVLARAWATAFGPGEWALVSLSLLLGVAIVPLAYVVGRSLASERAGVVAAYVFALSPALVEYSASVRPYSLLPLFCLLSVHALCCGMQGRGAWSWTVFVGSGLALLYTHNWALLVVSAEGVVVAILAGRSTTPPGITRRALASFVAIALLYAPWSPILLGQAEHAGHLAADVTSPLWFARGLAEAPGEFLFFWLWMAVLWIWPRAARRSASGGDASGEASTRITLLTVPLLAYLEAVALSLRSEMLFFRCLVIVFPCVLVALSVWLIQLFAGRALRVALVVMLVQLGLSVPTNAVTPVARSNARELAALLDRSMRADDLVIIAPIFLASSVNFYLRAPNEQIDHPMPGRQTLVSFRDVWGRLHGAADLAATVGRVRDARAARRRVWVVRPARFRPLAIDSAAAARGRWDAAANADASRLRDSVRAIYGEPALVAGTDPTPLRYERMVAELYSP